MGCGKGTGSYRTYSSLVKLQPVSYVRWKTCLWAEHSDDDVITDEERKEEEYLGYFSDCPCKVFVITLACSYSCLLTYVMIVHGTRYEDDKAVLASVLLKCLALTTHFV